MTQTPVYGGYTKPPAPYMSQTPVYGEYTKSAAANLLNPNCVSDIS